MVELYQKTLLIAFESILFVKKNKMLSEKELQVNHALTRSFLLKRHSLKVKLKRRIKKKGYILDQESQETIC